MKKKITSLLLCCFTVLLFGACDASRSLLGLGPSKVMAPVAPIPTSLNGTNLTGGDWSWTGTTTKPVSGQTHLFVSHQDIDYLVGKGVTFGRLVFSWELLQPVLNGAFDPAYDVDMADRVAYATSKGMTILIEPHAGDSANFARYKGNLVGSTRVPNSAFADLFVRLSQQYGSNSKVMFGLSNEPNNMSTMQWYAAAQAAIDGVRGTGANTVIFVDGNGWSQPASWNDTWYDTAPTKVSNATGWATLKDPINRTVVSVHTYFDKDGGGGALDIVSADIVAQRLQTVVTWARARGLKVHLSEFGLKPSVAGAQAAVTATAEYVKANSDVVIGWSWWAYGPPAWWGGYQFTLDPSSNYTVDAPQMAWLRPYFAPASPTPVADASVPVASPSFPTNPIAFTKNAVFTTNSGQTNWVYVPNGYDSTHNTPMTLFVWLHGCGGQNQYDVSMVSYMTNQSWITLAPGGRETTCWSNTATDGPKILAAIAELKTHFNVNPRSVVLGGYSSGGDVGYPLLFQNANMFAGGLFENTAPNGSSADTAAWKVNIVHLAHTGDTTYPISAAITWVTALQNKGFPVLLIQKAGTHYDNDNGAFGTQYDLRTFLLPHLNDGWLSPGSTPAPTPACVYTYSVWGVCPSTGIQTRTVTGTSPSPCTAGPQLLSQPCVYVPPPAPLCAYTYSAWGTCQSTNTQDRTVTGSSPTPCTATTQVTTQSCVYVPPVVVTDTDGDGILDVDDKCPTVAGIKTTDGTSNGCKPLVVSSVKTYDWGTGYCRQYYFTNPNPVPMSWKSMTIVLKDGVLRVASGVWGAIFPNPVGTSNQVVTPISGQATVLAGKKQQSVGFCANKGPTGFTGTSGGLKY